MCSSDIQEVEASKCDRTNRSVSRQVNRPRWHLIYYALALFDLVAVATGLFLNHRTMAIYEKSVEVNETWSALQSDLMELGRLAGAGNAPGNSVFETGDVAKERERLALEESAFAAHSLVCREEIFSREGQKTIRDLDRAEAEFAQMMVEAREIFKAIESENHDAAGRHMSAMDHHYYQVSSSISALTDHIAAQQKAAFAEQRDRARALRTIETILAAMILVMVAGVTMYGHFLARSMNRDAQELHDVHTKLVESELRARQVVESAGDGVVVLNSDGVIVEWNPRAEQTFGWRDSEAIGKKLSELIVPGDQRASHELKKDPAQSVGKTVTIQAVRKDGEQLAIELTLTPIRTPSKVLFSAILHDITKRKRAEAELERAHRQLVDASRQAGMAEIATGVLHNVGNVLNSVNISANLVSDTLRESRANRLAQAMDLMRENEDRLGDFLANDAKGKQLPGYLMKVSDAISAEQRTAMREIESLTENIEHIKSIVSTQQVYAKVCGVDEPVDIRKVLDDAVKMSAQAFDRHNVELVREDGDLPMVTLDRQKLLQIVVNLLRNAKHAICDHETTERQLIIRTADTGAGRITIDVIDTGIGISPDNLTRVFTHGFTTKKDGHGFGLHSSALAAHEMGGSLTAQSDGIGSGSRFTLALPVLVLEPVA